MSEQYLSQEEIDALLDTPEGDSGATKAAADAASGDSEPGASTDTAAAGSGAGTPLPGEARPYDLARQERIVRGRMPALELIHARFVRSLGLAMFGFMQRNPDITPGATEVIRYADFVAAVAAPSSINIMQTQPLQGSALLVLEGALVSTVVDLMFGGSGRPMKRHEGREFSDTEKRLIRKMVELSCTEYGKAWESIHPFRMVFSRSESQPQFANIAIPNEMVVATRFTLDFNGQKGDIRVCIPYSVLEPIRDTLSSNLTTQRTGGERDWSGQITQEIQPASVDMVAELTTATLTLGELMNLRKDDVIEIERGQLAVLKIGQVPMFSGRYGEHNGHYAVRIDTVHNYSESHQD